MSRRFCSASRSKRDLRLRDQLGSSSERVASLISEGFEQSTDRHFAEYCYGSRGSSREVRTQLIVAGDCRHTTEAERIRISEVRGNRQGVNGADPLSRERKSPTRRLRPSTADWRPSTADRRPSTADWRLATADSGGWRPRTGDHRPRTGDWRQRTGDWRLATGDYAVYSARSACTTSTRAARAAGTTDAVIAATRRTAADPTTGSAPGNCTSGT
jgi:four helix bundle protein